MTPRSAPASFPSLALLCVVSGGVASGGVASGSFASGGFASGGLARGGDDGDWPRWRGAHHDDTARAEHVFDHPFELRVAWKRAVGSGYAGVSVLGESAVTLASSEGSDWVVALDAASGAERWRHRLGPALPGLDGAVDGPVSTPTLAGDAVYALAGQGTLVALDLARGTPRWKHDLTAEFGAPHPHWGFTTAPLVVQSSAGELVIVAAGASDGRAFLAFSARDGALRWSAGSDAVRYQSPILTELDGRALVVAAGNTYLFGLDPATGAEAWRLKHGALDFYQEILQPLALGEGSFLLKSRQMGARRVQVEAEPTAALAEQWASRHLRQNYNMPVLHDGLLYGHGGSFLTCVDAESGELVWRSRPPGDGWVILVDGHLVVLTKAGSLHVVRATPDGYEERAALELFEHLTWTPPSFARGHVYARDSGRDVACVEIVPATPGPPVASAEADPLPTALAARLTEGSDRQAALEAFLASGAPLPLVEGGRTAHFFFRGPAEEVVLACDALPDDGERPMAKVAGTDVFHARVELEPDARVGYQFVRDLDEVLADPLNPRSAASLIAVGRVSELLMPAAEVTAAVPTGAGAAALETFVLDLPIVNHGGRLFGGPRRVWVQVPAGYAAGSARFPTLYVNDGANAIGPLALPELLAELAGKTMEPVIAVFVENQGAYELARAEQELYRDFLVERLVPEIDRRYRTRAEPAARAALGWLEGGYAALLAALSRPECFGAAASQALYHGTTQGQAVLEGLVAEARPLPRVGLDWGRHDARSPQGPDTASSSRALAAALGKRGADVFTREANDGAACTFWRARLPELLGWLFPPARAGAK